MKVLCTHKYVFFTVLLVFGLAVFSGHAPEQGEQGVFKAPQYVMAFPHPIDIQQPDGTALTILKVGDEVINYTRTSDDYTLLPNDAGIYYYAELDGSGDLVISGQKAANPGKRLDKEKNFLKKISKKLEYSEKQKKAKKDKWKKNKSGAKGLSAVQFGPIDDAFPSTGTRSMLVILASFTDKSFVKSNSNFNSIMNVGSSSFKAYYQDNSYNQLTVNTTVVGPYAINMSMSAADNNTRDFISRAVTAANNDGVDFSDYDNDSDGTMDALYVIHAGYGEEAGAPSYTIWSHSWDLGSYAKTYDGVYIFSYATSPELRGASGSSITSIGVIAHEFGHNIGVPDYYDTDGSGSGGSAWDLKSWDVMAGGSWNNSGDTPAQHNMYTKWKLGWSSPTTLSSDGSYNLRNTSDYNEAYRINTTTSNEFFILENRQQTGWDSYIGGHGMLIFHIDGGFIDGLSGNTVNANPSHQGVDVEEADNVRSSSTYGADPFPGTGNKTTFTDTTTPSAKSWAGNDTDQPLTDISEISGVVYFDYEEEDSGGGGSWSGYYRFMNRYSGYAMDVNSGSNYVYHYTWNGNTDKHWQIIQVDGVWHRIMNRYNGRALDVGSGNYVYNYTWNGNTDKHWQIIDLGTGYYRVDNRYSGYSLDTGGGSYVYHYTWNGNTDKHWQIIQIQ
jgi:M6 family metalloprotease-like protein